MEIGNVHDVVSLFSTDQRDFLIRNNGEKVKVESLKGKIVAILFLYVKESRFYKSMKSLDGESYISRLTTTMKAVYDDLSPQNNFEIVFVAKVSGLDKCHDKTLFDEFFSKMPWLAIPQDDIKSRTNLFSMLGSECPPLCTILDDKGKIVNLDAIPDFEVYGAECCPFTPERISEIQNDHDALRAEMSVKKWLTTPTRDFLIRSNYGSNFEKVPVSYLEGKAIAFYFYTGSRGKSETVDVLIDLYEKLRQDKKQFEVVFLQSRVTEDESWYMEAFGRTPFLGLPFNDRSFLKLIRILRCSTIELVIVAPGHSFPDTCGLDVIKHYGIKAYPFTRRSVIDMEHKRLTSWTLESILFSGRRYIESIDKLKIYARDLENKTVLLLFTEKSHPSSRELISRMTTWYNKTKVRDEEDVEIIHISYDHQNPGNECLFWETPWLQFRYEARYEKLFRKPLDLFCSMPLVIAYGANGEILTMDLKCKFLSDEEWESEIDYPFTHVDFYKELKYEIARKRRWPEPE